MKLPNWVKTIFSIYSCIGNLVGAIDKYIELKSVNSMYLTLENVSKKNTLNVFDDISKFINKKITLLNIKVIAEDILKKLNPNLSKYIIYRYLELRPTNEIATIFDCSLRTVWRTNALALKESCEILNKLGYSEKKLNDICKNEKWIADLVYKYENIDLIKLKKILVMRTFILKDECKELKFANI